VKVTKWLDKEVMAFIKNVCNSGSRQITAFVGRKATKFCMQVLNVLHCIG
jgi:hypothetical protein